MIPFKNKSERYIDEVMFTFRGSWTVNREANGLEPTSVLSLIQLSAQDKNRTGFSKTFPNELLMDCMKHWRTLSS